jgi:hypothetical protein
VIPRRVHELHVTYRVTVDGEVGRVDVPLAHAVQTE